MRHKSLSMISLHLRNIPFKAPTPWIDCNHKSQQSQIILRIFRFTDTNERHYILLFINKVLYYMDSPFRYWNSLLWFCDLWLVWLPCPFCICKDTKYNQKYKILNVWKNIIYKLTFCTHDDYKQLINDNSLTLYRIIAPLQTK